MFFCSPCINSEIRELCAKITKKRQWHLQTKWQHTKTTLLILDPEKRYSFAVPLLSSLWKRTFSYFPFVCLFVCLPGPVGVEWSGVEPLCVFVHFFSFGQQSVSTQMTGTNKKSGPMEYLCSPSSYKNDFLSIHTVWIRSTWGTVLLPLSVRRISFQASYCIVKIMPPKSQGQLQY